MPLGPDQQYIVTYNGQQLPGYAQSENDPNEMVLADHYAFGWDGSLTQYAGLTNKQLQMEFLVWEPTYRACKDQYHTATTILRSRKEGFAPLFVDYDDRYLNATVQNVQYSQNVSQSRKILHYTVDFNCEPWFISTSGYCVAGAGNLVTTGRTTDDGGWTPTTITVTGTNVTISGYTATEFTGYISLSGALTNFVIDTNAMTVTTASGFDGGEFVKWKDFGMFVGPGETTFAITGASATRVCWNNRWY